MTRKKSRLKDLLAMEFAGTWGGDPASLRPTTTVIRSTDIDDEGVASLTTGAKRDIPVGELRKKRLLPHDILLETSGGGPGRPVGRVAYFEGGKGAFVTSNFFRALRARDTADSRFIMRLLLHRYSQPSIWRYQQQTTGIINLNYRDYLDQPLELPPLPEQIRISEILDLFGRQIKETEELCRKLALIRTGLLDDLLIYGIKQDGQPRNDTELVQDAPIAPMPQEWDLQPAADLFTIQLGKMLDTKRFGGGRRFDYLTNRNIQWGKIGLDELETMPFSPLERKKFLLADGDVLMCEGGEVGRCAVWRHGTRDLYYQKALHRLRPKQGMNPDYFVAFMEWAVKRNGLASWVGRTSIAHFPLNRLSAFPVRIPPSSEQKRIVAVLGALKRSEESSAATLAKLRALRQGLSADLLTGRTRLPAEMLGD